MCIRIYFLCFLHLSISFLTCPWCHRSKFRSKDNWFVVLGFRYPGDDKFLLSIPSGLTTCLQFFKTYLCAAAWCPTGNIQTFRRSCKQRLRSDEDCLWQTDSLWGVSESPANGIWTYMDPIDLKKNHACGMRSLCFDLTFDAYIILYLCIWREFFALHRTCCTSWLLSSELHTINAV